MNKFIPKQYKHLKLRQKLKYKKSVEIKHTYLKKGNLGLKVMESGQISDVMLESIRRALSRRIKKQGKVIFFIHPNIPLTKKSVGTRMGKGSGSFHKWIFPIKQGKILLELLNVPKNLGLLALKAASFKLPIKTKIIERI